MYFCIKSSIGTKGEVFFSNFMIFLKGEYINFTPHHFKLGKVIFHEVYFFILILFLKNDLNWFKVGIIFRHLPLKIKYFPSIMGKFLT